MRYLIGSGGGEYRPLPVVAGILLACASLMCACGAGAQTQQTTTLSPVQPLGNQVAAPAPSKSGEPAQSPPGTLPPAPGDGQAPPADQTPGGQQKRRKFIYVGPDIGVYLPTNGKTSSRFGGQWSGIGVGIGSISHARDRGKFEFDLHILSQSNGDDYVEVGLIGAQYRKLIFPGRRNALLKPYFGASADLAVGDIRSLEDNVHAGIQSGIAGGVFVGMDITNRAYVDLRYIQTSTIKGFDLSGISISAGYRVPF